MRGMQVADLELALARSRMDDDTYTDAVALVRGLLARVVASDDLARAVEDAEHYLPDTVIAALGRYRLAGLADARTVAA